MTFTLEAVLISTLVCVLMTRLQSQLVQAERSEYRQRRGFCAIWTD